MSVRVPQGPHHPGQRGFDEAIVSMGRHFNFDTSPKTDYLPGTYLADFLTERAIDFIRRHKDGPFFLYLPHFGVHVPHEAKESSSPGSGPSRRRAATETRPMRR